MLTHKQLRYFVEIVDAGSFSQAAQRLFIAQSALSRQVREMEQSLQVVLLERDARQLALTAAGRTLYDDARRILALLQEAALRAGDAQRGNAGTLTLLHSSSVPLEPRVLALLEQQVQACRGLSFEISQASSESQALEIKEGRADLGLVRAPLLRRYAELHYEPLYTEPLWVALPAQHPLASRASVRMDDLHAERFVALPHVERGGLSHRVAELCRQAGFQPQPAAVRSRKWSQLALVQAGFGITVVPASMARQAPAGVHTLPLEGGDCTTQVMALWRRDAPPLVQRFTDALRQAI
jgi:DNA-binding transcriptional LysR family regulator